MEKINNLQKGLQFIGSDDPEEHRSETEELPGLIGKLKQTISAVNI